MLNTPDIAKLDTKINFKNVLKVKCSNLENNNIEKKRLHLLRSLLQSYLTKLALKRSPPLKILSSLY